MSYHKPIKLLIVEDDETDFYLLEMSLRKTSFQKQIIWADSFDGAVEKLHSEPFDLVIVDYKLGVYTGLELVSYINENFPFTPTIFLTGLKTAAIDEEALKSGVYDYLAKDQYTSDDIDRSIRYAIEKSKVLKSLKESENKFKNLFENSVEYVFIVDGQLSILDANKSVLRLFQAKGKEEIIGTDISELIEPAIFAEGLSAHSAVEIELRVPASQKRTFCILNSSVVDVDNNIHQLVMHDITERKLNEQKEKLLEKQALTGKVARIIAHEIKNPLTSIHLSVAELKDLLSTLPKTAEDPDDFLKIIDRNARRINMLIEDLLNATRFDTIEFQELLLDDLLIETISLVEDRVQLKKIRIEKTVHQNSSFKGDREKLVIALLNVLVNAVEAVAEREEACISISTSAADEMLLIEISDNGKGIPARDIQRLFEPFFTSKKGGTGLGLAATYNIIAKHDGAIKVKSEVYSGTSFIISLPVRD